MVLTGNVVSPKTPLLVRESEPQGTPLGLRVRDAGESESLAVMVRIGVQTLLHAKAGRLPAGLSSRENLSAKQKTGVR